MADILCVNILRIFRAQYSNIHSIYFPYCISKYSSGNIFEFAFGY